MLPVWNFDRMSVKKVRNGYCVTITEFDFWKNKKHKIYFRTTDDVNKYTNSITYIQNGIGHRVLEVPDGFISKKELKPRKNKTEV